MVEIFCFMMHNELRIHLNLKHMRMQRVTPEVISFYQCRHSNKNKQTNKQIQPLPEML